MEILNKDFPVYVIRSSWSLARMDEFLKDYEDVPFLRIVHNKDGTETNRTLVILKKSTYEKLCEEGYGKHSQDFKLSSKEFHVYPFVLDKSDFPFEGHNRTLFVPIHKNLSKDDSFVASTVTDKLKQISEQNIFRENSWDYYIPLVSREEGEIKGGCFITFDDDITTTEIAMIRVLLCDTYWPERDELEERFIFRCYWFKKPKESKKNKYKQKPKENNDEFGSKRILARVPIPNDEQPIPQ